MLEVLILVLFAMTNVIHHLSLSSSAVLDMAFN